MTIERVSIQDFGDYWKLEAAILFSNWKEWDSVVYYSDTATWSSDRFTISDNIKKMCRREWYKLAKMAGISRKELNVLIKQKH